MHSKSASSIKVVVSAILGNGLLTVAKFMGWTLSASPSMLAEAIHSLADTANQLLLFVGFRHSRRGPSKQYPWGSSRAQYVWNLISAVGIFFMGCGVTVYQGMQALIAVAHEPTPLPSMVSFYILGLAFVIEGFVFMLALRSVNEQRGNASLWEYIRFGDNPTVVAVLMEDGIAVTGVLVALLGIFLTHYLGSPYPDAIAAIFIGLLLGLMAAILAAANGRLLIGYSGSASRRQEIKEFIEALKTVEKVAKIKTTVLGPGQIRLSLEIEFHGAILIDRDMIVDEAEKIRSGKEDPLPVLVDNAERMVRVVGREINKLERLIKKKFPEVMAIELEVN